MQDKFISELTISRRKFIQALAAIPILGMAKQPADAAAPANFSFVYLTDTHLTTGVPDSSFKMVQESQLFLQECVKSINALKPDFIIFGGDQVETVGANEKNWQLFVDIAAGLNAPWYFVLGEQDVSSKPPIDKMRTFGPDFKGRGIKESNPYWSADPMPGVHLIGLDTSAPNSSVGNLEEDQLAWLKGDLAANKGKFTIIITHHPLLAPPPYDGGPPWEDYVLPNGSDAREIIAASNDVRLVLGGHLYMNKVQLESNVYHVSAAGLDVYPCQYKYFKVSKTGIAMQSFEVPFPALIKKAMKALSSSNLSSKYNRQKPDAFLNLCMGEEQDQNAFLALGAAKSIRALTKKEIKDQQKILEDRVQAEEEAVRNKGKGKKDDKKAPEKSTGKDEKKSDSDTTKSNSKEEGKEKESSDSEKGSLGLKDSEKGKGSDSEQSSKNSEKSKSRSKSKSKPAPEKSDSSSKGKEQITPDTTGAADN